MAYCEECGDQIPPKRLRLVPTAKRCVDCQSTEDVFKYKMKTVGYNEEPTIARTEDHWKVLEKQKKVKDI